MYPISRITGEGRVEFLRAWGPGFEQEGAGGGGGGEETGGATQSNNEVEYYLFPPTGHAFILLAHR